MWRPTDRMLTSADGKQVSSTVAWSPILPPGVTVKEAPLLARSGVDGGHSELSLDVHDIAPQPKEQFMPPMHTVSFKVLFYYTSFRTTKEFWASAGKDWAKSRDKFIGPGSAVKEAVGGLVAPGDTQDQKVRKLYAAAMQIENTDFTRAHSTNEERAAGLKNIKSGDDVWTRKRGSSDQIAATFVGMVRAAGMKAYLMGVANRRERLFMEGYLSLEQLDDDIAIVNVDGKDVFLDPGERYCPYGQLSWVHAMTGGLRETDHGVEVANTDALNYKDIRVIRVADLKVDETGIATGQVSTSYTGAAALEWRHEVLRGDETSLKESLRTNMEHLLPAGIDIKVTKIENLTEYEQPLKVTFQMTGAIGSSTGKRLLVTGDLFETNSKPKFPEAKRELPVDLRYPSAGQDVVRLTLAPGMVVESSPAPVKNEAKGIGLYSTEVATTPASITLRRNFIVGVTALGSKDYADLRDFYGKADAKDREPVVLTRSGAAAPAAGSGEK